MKWGTEDGLVGFSSHFEAFKARLHEGIKSSLKIRWRFNRTSIPKSILHKIYLIQQASGANLARYNEQKRWAKKRNKKIGKKKQNFGQKPKTFLRNFFDLLCTGLTLKMSKAKRSKIRMPVIYNLSSNDSLAKFIRSKEVNQTWWALLKRFTAFLFVIKPNKT